jgi:hypothetical protein
MLGDMGAFDCFATDHEKAFCQLAQPLPFCYHDRLTVDWGYWCAVFSFTIVGIALESRPLIFIHLLINDGKITGLDTNLLLKSRAYARK